MDRNAKFPGRTRKQVVVVDNDELPLQVRARRNARQSIDEIGLPDFETLKACEKRQGKLCSALEFFRRRQSFRAGIGFMLCKGMQPAGLQRRLSLCNSAASQAAHSLWLQASLWRYRSVVSCYRRLPELGGSDWWALRYRDTRLT